MRHGWILVGVLLVLTAVCWGEKAKKGVDKAKKDAEKTKKEAETAPVAPPAQPKVIKGYRSAQWGMPQDKVMATESRNKDILQEPDYLVQLGLPDDVKGLVPEGGKLPRRAPFRNFEAMLDPDAAECKAVYYFFDDNLYMIFVREPILREVLKFKGWRERMLERLGAPTSENPDGTMIWDQDITCAKATPIFSSSGGHTDETILETFTVFTYNKKAKKEIIEWMKKNLKAGE